MTLNRCDCCRGRGTIVGLGSMERKCGQCHGVGHVKIEVLKSVVDHVAADVVVKVKRKRRTPTEMLADSDKVYE